MESSTAKNQPLVLLVDDSAVQREMLHEALDTSKFQLLDAQDGADALSKLARYPVAAIVADGEMPVLDGYQLCRLVKGDAATQHIPFILLTVQPQGFRRLRAQTCGADHFAPKGNRDDLAQLAAILEGCFADSDPSGPPMTSDARHRDLRGWLSTLAQSVEASLLESTVRRRVAELYDGSHDVHRLCEGFIDLLEDVIMPGGIAVAFPYLEGWRTTARCSETTSGPLRDEIAKALSSHPLVPLKKASLAWREVTARSAPEVDTRVLTRVVGLGTQPCDGLVVVGLGTARLEQHRALLDASLEELGRVMHIERTHLEVYRAAVRDALTGAWNRRYLMELMERELARIRRYGGTLTAIMVDVDHFKDVNDKFGHLVGDEVLQELARRLQSSIRTSDELARLGGEEFLILCPHTQPSRASILAERLRARVEDPPFRGVPEGYRITVSVGVAGCDGHTSETVQQLLGRVDNELYRAKAAGRNRVSVESSTSARAS